MTDWLRPATLDDALSARRAHAGFLLIAGGTDVMVAANALEPPPGVIDLFGLPELVGIDLRDGALRIGAATTYAAMLRSDHLRLAAPLLAAAAREIGAVQIQERGTIGGNVCTSSPVGDTLPALLALDAVVEVASQGGSRDIPYDRFCTGYRRSALAADEILVAVRIPVPPHGTRFCWRKVAQRRAQAISKVAFAGVAQLDSAGSVVSARLAFGAVADRPLRVRDAEALLVGAVPSVELARAVANCVAGSITPLTDARSTASYRRAVASNLAGAFVKSLCAQPCQLE